MSTVAASQFDAEGQGHPFELRAPVAKATARRCRECGADIFLHARGEVGERDLLVVLNATAEREATTIADGVMVGGFRAAIATAEGAADVVVLNCAGKRLHSHLPKSRAPMEALRAQGRLRDLEWDDVDGFTLPPADLLAAAGWVQAQLGEGRRVVINCAQGRSRSGAAACAWLMASRRISADAALAEIQRSRPLVQPNPGFMAQLRRAEAALHAAVE